MRSLVARKLASLGMTASAESGGLFGNDEMGFMGTRVGVGDAVGERLDGEEAVGFEDAAFAVDPGGFSEPMLLHVL
jgi:hypothetical protein